MSKLKEPGTYEDGGGLRLVVSSQSAKRWVLRVSSNGRRRELGLGSFPAVSLEDARAKAGELRTAIKSGKDPVADKRKTQRTRNTTFADAFETFFTVKRQTLSNKKHREQWVSTMRTYVFPAIGDTPIADITASDILDILTPIWFEKPETARRVLQRMEAVFKSAILRGTRTLASPCIGVAQELGNRNRIERHHAALPWQEVPKFITELRSRASMLSTKLALEFLILSAARSGEVRGAVWSEIDLDKEEWRIPGSRMKGRLEHVVPLADRSIEILNLAKQVNPNSRLIFPGQELRQLSDMTFTKLIRDMGYGTRATAHGFRSSFKDWAAEEAKVFDEVSEAALAHKVAEKVRAAYLRTKFLEERKQLMSRWAMFVTSAG